MAVENIGSYPEINEQIAEKAFQILNTLEVRWQGRDVTVVAEELCDKIVPLFASKTSELSSRASVDLKKMKVEVVKLTELLSQKFEDVEESDRLFYFDPVSGAYQVLLAAQKHHKHKKRKWWTIGAIVAVVAAAVIVTIATGGGAGPAAQNGAGSAIAAIVATDPGKEGDKKKDNKNASSSPNNPPPPKPVATTSTAPTQTPQTPAAQTVQEKPHVQSGAGQIPHQVQAVTKSQTASAANVPPVIKHTETTKAPVVSSAVRTNLPPKQATSVALSNPYSSIPIHPSRTYPISILSKQPEPFPAPSSALGSGQSSNPAAIPPSLMDPITPTDFNAKINPTTIPTSRAAQIEAITTPPISANQIQGLTSPPSLSSTSIGPVDLKLEKEKKILARSTPTSVPSKTPFTANLTPPIPTSPVPTLNPVLGKGLVDTYPNNEAMLSHARNLLEPLKAVPTTPPLSISNMPSKQSELIAMIDPDAPVRMYSTAPEIKPPIIFQLEGPKLARGCIGGINGIGNNLDEAKNNAEYLKKLAGNQHVEWVHNRTNSIPLDIAEAAFANFNGYSAPAKQLKEQWTNFHEKHKDNLEAKYLQFCHSQGALHVRNALAHAPKEIRDRIIVVAIAPAGIVPKGLCFQSYNYMSKKDPIPYIQITSLLGSGEVLANSRLAEAILAELVFLDPHPDAPSFDHSFQSPTFEKIIEKHINDYIKEFGEIK